MVSRPPSPLTPRRFTPAFAADIPRHWLPDNPAVCAILNTYTVLVPANESFYIRTLKQCLPRFEDPAMRRMIDDFIRQEAQHGVAHARYWRNLEAQGYRFRGFERAVGVLTYRLIERTAPLSLRVSIVSCVEHVNAYLAHEYLSQRILTEAHPQMRALMEWHFAEEIEHKHVAFDVLREVSPGYPMRLLGFAVTVPLFYASLAVGMLRFLRQDGLLFRRSVWSRLRWHLGRGHHMVRRTAHHLLDYLRPGFHPGQLEDHALAQAVIARYAQDQPPTLSPARATAASAAHLGLPPG